MGEQDHQVPSPSAEQLIVLDRSATISRFPESGHLPYLEDPATFNRTLEDFLHRQAASVDGATRDTALR